MFAGVLIAAWLAYAPGLSGAFLFDDFANLPSLGNYGPVDNHAAFWRYITSGFADPTGRPLSLLSFLIDAQNWPADPAPFKRTNVLIHLLNGVLLCALLLRLGRAWGRSESSAAAAAVLGAALWLLHPLWVSTTLYVVQREAMLPATFILLGLLGYLHGRAKIAEQQWLGTSWILVSVGLCTLLAFLSKANGLLLPLFVLTIEQVCLRSARANGNGNGNVTDRLGVVLGVAVYPVVAGVSAYLLYKGYSGLMQGTPAFRPWSLGQRVLTEPRVVLEYLKLLFVPRAYSRGLFNDDIEASTDLLHPWTTLPAMLVVGGLIFFAWKQRRRYPAIALALLFYFAGQLMESTTIPLELYFEHRNYVPALLLFWPLALWLTDRGSLARLKPVLALCALALLTAQTYFAARLWGEPDTQALVWAAQNPQSPRAQTYAATVERSTGNFQRAELRLRHALASHPDEIQLAINLLGVRCQLGSISEPDVAAAEVALRNGSNRGPLSIDWIEQAIGLMVERSCEGMDAAMLQRLIDASSQNAQAKSGARFRQDLLDLEGQLALATGDTARAEQKFRAALEVEPRPGMALKQAALLGAHGLPEAGLAQLDYYARAGVRESPAPIRDMAGLHEWLLRHDGFWDTEIAHLRQTLNDDVSAKSAPLTEADPVR